MYSDQGFLRAGVALYWAEGSKAENTALIFVNSDPNMILFMFKWFQKVGEVSIEDFKPQVFINAVHAYRIDDVLRFWSNLLDLPVSSFLKTYFSKAVQKKVYENHDRYYGILRLRIRKGTFLKYKIIALIDNLKLPA